MNPQTERQPEPAALAVLYLRVSTGRQAEHGTSLETQEATGRAEAARRGAQVLGVHTDEVSGALYNRRAGLQAALAQVEALRSAHPHVPVCLIIARYDRSARDITIQREIERRLRVCGAALVSCDGTPGENTAPAKLFRTMRSGVAEFERDLIRERTLDGRLAAAHAGRQPAPRLRPYGYRVILKSDIYPGSAWTAEDAGRYVVIPEEAAIIAELFTRYGAGQWSLRAAVRELNARAIPTMYGGKWAPPTLWWMLHNPAYVGRARYNWREILRAEREDGSIAYTSRRRDPAEVVTIPCPAIVSEAVFAAVQARLSSNQRTYGSTPARRHLLSGLLRCPTCGRGLFGRPKPLAGAGAAIIHYRCAQGNRDGGCNRRYWRGDELDALVLAALAQVAQSPQVVAHALSEARGRRKRLLADRDALERQAQECRRKEALIVQAEIAALTEGRDVTPYRAALRETATRRLVFEEQLALAWSGEEKAADVDAAEIVAALSGVQAILSDARLPFLERAGALRQVVAAVRPFDAGPARDRRCSPALGAEIEFYPVDGVSRITIRATPSRDTGVSIDG